MEVAAFEDLHRREVHEPQINQTLEIGTSPCHLNPQINRGTTEPFQPIKYNQKFAKSLGIVQKLIGIVCLTLNSVLVGADDTKRFPSLVCYGIWGGLLIFAAGLLGVMSANRAPNIFLIVGTLVMSTVATCVSVIIFVFGTLETITGQKVKYKTDISDRCNTSSECEKSVTLGVILALLAMFESVISISSSTLCCQALCCGIAYVGNNADNRHLTTRQANSSDYQELVVIPDRLPTPGVPSPPFLSFDTVQEQ